MLLGFFFYRSVWALLPMALPSVLYIWWEMNKERQRRKKYLVREFGECILSVAGSVKAGYAVENAFLESMADMRMMYGPEADILKELNYIKGGLSNHVPLEKLLREMGARTGLVEISEFADIFEITKRSGGNLADVIAMTAQAINRKASLEEELIVMQAARRLEQKIMNMVPFFLMAYMEITSPGYFDMYYADVGGRLIMTLFLVWYMAAYAASEYVLHNACV